MQSWGLKLGLAVMMHKQSRFLLVVVVDPETSLVKGVISDHAEATRTAKQTARPAQTKPRWGQAS
jgi:hypothetical protein